MITLRWVKTFDGEWHLMVKTPTKNIKEYWRSVGRICANGVWYVRDKDGVGGQNSTESDIQKAKDAVVHCAIMDGFIPGIQFEEKQ